MLTAALEIQNQFVRSHNRITANRINIHRFCVFAIAYLVFVQTKQQCGEKITDLTNQIIRRGEETERLQGVKQQGRIKDRSSATCIEIKLYFSPRGRI